VPKCGRRRSDGRLRGGAGGHVEGRMRRCRYLIHTHTHTHTHTQTHTHIHTCIAQYLLCVYCISIHVCMYRVNVYMYTCRRMYAYMYMYLCTCIYVCTIYSSWCWIYSIYAFDIRHVNSADAITQHRVIAPCTLTMTPPPPPPPPPVAGTSARMHTRVSAQTAADRARNRAAYDL